MATKPTSPELTLVSQKDESLAESFKAALRVTAVGPDLFKINKNDWKATVGPAFERMSDKFSFAATAPDKSDLSADGIRRYLACLSYYASLFDDMAESVMIDGEQLGELQKAADRALAYHEALDQSHRDGNVIHLGLK